MASGNCVGEDIDSGAIQQETHSKVCLSEEPLFKKEQQEKLSREHEPGLPPKSEAENEELKSFCEEVNVIIHVVNDNEFQAATKHITAPNSTDGSGNGTRFCGGILGMFAGIKIALIQTRPGANSGTDMREKITKLGLKCEYIIAVGVCFAFDTKTHLLSDILIANRITSTEDYKFAGSEVRLRGSRYELEGYLNEVFCREIYNWDFKVSSSDRSSESYCGLFLSGSILFSSEDQREKFKRAEPEAIGGEMEGYQLLKLKDDEIVKEIIVIKAVADYGDEDKAKNWQFTAAMAAFDFVQSVIKKKGANFSKSESGAYNQATSQPAIPRVGGISDETSNPSLPSQSGNHCIVEDTDAGGGTRVYDCHLGTLIEQLNKCMPYWDKIALYLGFQKHEVDVIQTNPMIMVRGQAACMSEVLGHWFQFAPGDHRGSTEYATLEALKSAVNRAGYGEHSEGLHL